MIPQELNDIFTEDQKRKLDILIECTFGLGFDKFDIGCTHDGVFFMRIDDQLMSASDLDTVLEYARYFLMGYSIRGAHQEQEKKEAIDRFFELFQDAIE